MALDYQEVSCWRAARPCPMSDSAANHKLSCQAWYRCEVAGDYVIRWRCQSSEEGEINATNTTLSLCANQSDHRGLTDCPPPMVCADDPYLDNEHMKNTDLSTDVILAIAVSIFALLAVLLILLSSYKYWSMRKRFRRRATSRHYLIRDFPHPVRYHNMWGAGYHQWDHQNNKNAHLSKSNGSLHPDVYFSRPQESSSYFERLLPLDDLMYNNKELWGSGPSTPRRLFSNSGKFVADPSVATGSFVFHQPTEVNGLGGYNERVESWANQNTKMNKDKEGREANGKCFHVYKGNHTKFQTQEGQHSTRKCSSPTNECKRIQDTSPEFSRVAQVSSIAIPTFEFGGLQKTMAGHEYMSTDLHTHEDFSEQRFQKTSHQTNIADENVSRNAFGFVSRISNTQHCKVNNESHHSSSHKHQIVSPRGVRANNVTSSHPSPDVISSHNFTNRFVRVGKNVYRQLLSKSASASSINMSNSSNDNIDLSYDSFRNEHLRELARRGAASSSTLEAGYRQKGHAKSAALNNRY